MGREDILRTIKDAEADASATLAKAESESSGIVSKARAEAAQSVADGRAQAQADAQKMIDDAQSPLTDRHNQELEHLVEQEEVFGSRGSGRQEVIERHRREIRRLRDDELRFGLATLSRRYRDLGIENKNSGGLDAVGVITGAASELMRNPNERLLLQALFLNLSAKIEA